MLNDDDRTRPRVPESWRRRWKILRSVSVLVRPCRRWHPVPTVPGSGRIFWLEPTTQRPCTGWCVLQSSLIINQKRWQDGNSDRSGQTVCACVCVYEQYPESPTALSIFVPSILGRKIRGRSLESCQKLTHPLMICRWRWCRPCPIDRTRQRRKVSLSGSAFRYWNKGKEQR